MSHVQAAPASCRNSQSHATTLHSCLYSLFPRPLIELIRAGDHGEYEHVQADMPVGPVVRDQQPLSSLLAAPSSPDPQLDEYRTVVGELFPDGFVGLPIGDLADEERSTQGSTRRSTTM
jgi:hypothetical protein